MSFYGSIQYQISDAFSQIFIKNSGKALKNFITNPEEEVIIAADGREGRLYIDSGNSWINLKGDASNNSCKIYHAEPDENADNSVSLLNLVTDEIEITEIKDDATILDLNNDIYLKSAYVNYDDAGHVYNGNTNQYFKIPKLEIIQSIDSLEAAVDLLNKWQEETVNPALDNLEGLQTTVGDFINKIGNKESVTEDPISLCQAIGSLDYLRIRLGTSKNICEIIEDIGGRVQDMDELSTKIIKLENRIDALEGK